MLQRKPRVTLALTLSSVWATASALAVAMVSSWGQALLLWCVVVTAGVPLFTGILWLVDPERIDWDAELVQLLEEMDR